MKTDTTGTLLRAAAIIEQGWCQGATARDRWGSAVAARDMTATEWCVWGALCVATDAGPEYGAWDASVQLVAALPRYYRNRYGAIPEAVQCWNDARGQTAARVAETLRRAAREGEDVKGGKKR